MKQPFQPCTNNGEREADGTMCHSWLPLLHRPRVLYVSTFVWLTMTGGRFLAPFLEHEAHLTPQEIGTCLAVQQGTIALFSVLAGSWADTLEAAHPGKGRLGLVALGVLLSTISFMGHGLHHVLPASTAFANTLLWHVFLKALYGAAVAMVFPVLDALTVDYLRRKDSVGNRGGRNGNPYGSPQPQQEHTIELIEEEEENSNTTKRLFSSTSTFPSFHSHDDDDDIEEEEDSKNYGKERLHGPFWWGVANLLLSPFLDSVGFAICYPLAIAGVVFVLGTIVFYYQANNPFNGSEHEPTDTTTSSENHEEEEVDSLVDVTTSTSTDASDTDLYSTSNDLVVALDVFVDEAQVLSSVRDIARTETNEGLSFSSSPSRNVFVTAQRLVFSSAFAVAFCICLVCTASGQAIVDNLVFLFFESSLGRSWTIMGVTVVVKIAAEVPVFFYGPQLLRLGGPGGVLVLGSVCYFTRAVAYTVIPTSDTNSSSASWTILCLEPLHGITFGAVHVSAVEFAAQQAAAAASDCGTNSHEALAQGLVAFIRASGGVIGVYMGGWAANHLGPQSMFRLSAFCVLAGIGVLLFVKMGRTLVGPMQVTSATQRVSAMLVARG